MDANDTYYNSLNPEAICKHRDVVRVGHSLNICDKIIGSILKNIDCGKKICWLDVGCGTGGASNIAEKLGISYTGIDSSAVNIEFCRKNHKHEFFCGDFTTAELGGKFQIITFFSSLHHFADWRQAVDRAVSLLDPQGALYIEQEPTRWFAKAYALWLKMVSSEFLKLKGVEVHWLDKPSILAEELPKGYTEYHYDFIPGLCFFNIHTKKPIGSKSCAHYRKIIFKKEL